MITDPTVPSSEDVQQSKYYAHSLKDEPQEKWQTLECHLKAVAEMAARFAEPFGSADWAWNVGWLHDLGKGTNAFQSYLLRSNELDDSHYDADGSTSNHASTGAAWAEQHLGRRVGTILAYLSAGHHAGLPDWHTAETGHAALPCRLVEGRRNLSLLREWTPQVENQMRRLQRAPSYVREPGDFAPWIRMLFSSLVDADFLDTEGFMNRERATLRGEYPDLVELSDQFSAAIRTLEADAKPSTVNALRCTIRQACERAAVGAPGLYSLSVPTGGGKTLSAVAFALRHAGNHRSHGFRRIIYVIPYTSIIEQTAATLASIFGRENVVEHHSNLVPERETERSRMAAENWDAPIIVTTNVQFFESLYAARSSRCRKVHNIARSIVILDEAQLLPPRWLTPCVAAINQLVTNYGVTLLLATATQPALPGLKPVTEIIPATLDLYTCLRRTVIHPPASLSAPVRWDELANRLHEHRQVLCIVNTRRDCYDLYKQMPQGAIHLSALMCGRHRSAVIRLIKQRLRMGRPVRVVSTQLVEAGVDIDFPVVYRALAGLDSVAQAAGRCDREGRLTAAGTPGQVYIFVAPKPAPPGLLRKGEDRTRELLACEGLDVQQPETLRRYFELFYSAINDTGAEWLNERLVRDSVPNLAFQFRTAGNEFRLIEDRGQQAVFVRHGQSAKWLRSLRYAGPTRTILRALQRYTVSVSKWNFEQARADGLLEDLWQGEYWCWAPRYDRSVGLDLFGGGWTPDDLII